MDENNLKKILQDIHLQKHLTETEQQQQQQQQIQIKKKRRKKKNDEYELNSIKLPKRRKNLQEIIVMTPVPSPISSRRNSLTPKSVDFDINLNYDVKKDGEGKGKGKEGKRKGKWRMLMEKYGKLLIYGRDEEEIRRCQEEKDEEEEEEEEDDDDEEEEEEEEEEEVKKENEKGYIKIYINMLLKMCCYKTKDKKKKKKKKKKKGGLGIIMGVIIPVILNIFGVILFLRLPMCVGNAGVILSIVIFTIGYIVTSLTISSICAISTNGTIAGGGCYFMISRVLGPELGGSIGSVFFFANVAGAALYVIGFIDSLIYVAPVVGNFLGSEYLSKLVASTAIVIILCVICVVGADFFSKTGVIIFLILLFSLTCSFVSLIFLETPLFASFLPRAIESGYTGWSWKTFLSNLYPYKTTSVGFNSFVNNIVSNCTTVMNNTVNLATNCSLTDFPKLLPSGSYYIDVETTEQLNFKKIFGIIFPACTGALAGANLSGDLKDPSYSIPKGSILSLVFTYIVYIILIIIFGFTVSKEALISNYSIISQINFWPVVVSIGIFSATISSGLTSIIGGSRVLSALAKDNLIPFLGLFSIDTGCKKKEPRIAVIFTALLVQLLVFGSKIGFIIPFVTQFFLAAYALTNFATFALDITQSPNYRPTFKYSSKWTSFAGVVFCLTIMFYIDYIYASVTLLVIFAITILISVYAKPKNWGGIVISLMYYFGKRFQVRINSDHDSNIKYWRLKTLVLVSHPAKDFNVIRLFDDMSSVKGGLGIIGYVHFGNFRKGMKKYLDDKKAFYNLIKEANLQLFFEMTFAETLHQGIDNLLLMSGFSGMYPDIACIGFLERSHDLELNTEKYSYTKRGKVLHSIQDFTNIKRCKEKVFSLSTYMNVLIDIFFLKDGLIITRNFRSMNRSSMKPSSLFDKIRRKKLFKIDFWILLPFSRLTELEETMENTTSLMLQLGGLIINSSIWKKYHRLRVCLVVDLQKEDSEEVNKKRKIFQRMLDIVRIDAEIKIIPLKEGLKRIVINEEQKRRNSMKGKLVAKRGKHVRSFSDLASPVSSGRIDFDDIVSSAEGSNKREVSGSMMIKSRTLDDLELINYKNIETTFEFIPKKEIKFGHKKISFFNNVRLKIGKRVVTRAEEMNIYNKLIKDNSKSTSITFITLPTPPEKFKGNESFKEYFDVLDMLTRGLKPTLMVYSNKNVISTQL